MNYKVNTPQAMRQKREKAPGFGSLPAIMEKIWHSSSSSHKAPASFE